MMKDEKRVYLKLFNTLTRENDKIIITDKPLKIYTCGPTVYHYAHIGNFRTYLFEDLLRRTLKYFGFKVQQVMNITDIDDKTIKGAIEAGKSLNDYTQPYIDAFFEDMEALKIEKAEVYPYATDHVSEMIDMIQKLIDEGVAYQGKDGSIYYSIRHFPGYGRLSHFKLSDLEVNASNRNEDEYDKENASDFVLWKSYDEARDGPVFWDSPFGKGRPGWHIECSAMAIKHLGETLDIHIGGVDNIFPHHENEIAQSEACTGKCFAKHWLHAEHLLVDGTKMSKSKGNFYTLRDLLDQGYSGQEVRFALIQTHYRTQLNFTKEVMDGAKNGLRRLNDFISRIKEVSGEQSLAYRENLANAHQAFCDALCDDLNISEALAAIFNLVRELNSLIDQNQIDSEAAKEIITKFEDFNRVLGFISFEEHANVIPEDLLKAFQLRQEARANRNFEEADRQRKLIEDRGYVIEDSPTGSKIKKK